MKLYFFWCKNVSKSRLRNHSQSSQDCMNDLSYFDTDPCRFLICCVWWTSKLGSWLWRFAGGGPCQECRICHMLRLPTRRGARQTSCCVSGMKNLQTRILLHPCKQRWENKNTHLGEELWLMLCHSEEDGTLYLLSEIFTVWEMYRGLTELSWGR